MNNKLILTGYVMEFTIAILAVIMFVMRFCGVNIDSTTYIMPQILIVIALSNFAKRVSDTNNKYAKASTYAFYFILAASVIVLIGSVIVILRALNVA